MSNKSIDLKARLKFKTDMVLTGFSPLYHKHNPISPISVKQLQFNNLSYEENYTNFKNNVYASINHSYLPVYRMADGEFLFLASISNVKLSYIETVKKIILNAKQMLRAKPFTGKTSFINYIHSIFDTHSVKTCFDESYTKTEIDSIKTLFLDSILDISQNGILAVHFIEYFINKSKDIQNIDFVKNNIEYQKQINFALDWFDRHCPNLNENNYTSFYYIYALLTGPDSYKLFQNKRVLIITSLTTKKMSNIEDHLKNKGAENVSFYNISPTKSMFEKIDFTNIKKPDIVLIGAGIGSVNILTQCRRLDTVCIDAGIVLEAYNNNKLFGSRLFLKQS